MPFAKRMVFPLHDLVGPYVDDIVLDRYRITRGTLRFDDGYSNGRQLFLAPASNQTMLDALVAAGKGGGRPRLSGLCR